MSQLTAALQTGNTIKVVAATTAPTALQAPSKDSVGSMQYVITVIGANPVWLGYGTNAAIAAANAVIPSGGGGSSAFSFPVPASATGVQITISAPPNSFFTAITAASTSDVYVTPCEGV